MLAGLDGEEGPGVKGVNGEKVSNKLRPLSKNNFKNLHSSVLSVLRGGSLW